MADFKDMLYFNNSRHIVKS